MVPVSYGVSDIPICMPRQIEYIKCKIHWRLSSVGDDELDSQLQYSSRTNCNIEVVGCNQVGLMPCWLLFMFGIGNAIDLELVLHSYVSAQIASSTIMASGGRFQGQAGSAIERLGKIDFFARPVKGGGE